MDGMKSVLLPVHLRKQPYPLQQDLRDFLPVPSGKLLADLHVMKIILQKASIEIAQILRHGGLPLLPGNGLQSALDFLFPILLLIGAYNLVPLQKIGLLALVQIHRQLLIQLRHLLAQIPAPGVDHQIFDPVPGLVHFDEMVSAPQCSKTALQPFRILQAAVAAKLLQVEFLLPAFPDMHARRHIMSCLVKPFKIDFHISQPHRIHPAADVHSHDIGHRFVRDGHGSADGASLPCMNVGHDPDFAALSEFVIAHSADLLYGFLLHHSAEADCLVHFTFDLKHILFPFFPFPCHGSGSLVFSCALCSPRFPDKKNAYLT